MSDTCVNHIENYWKILTEEANESFNEGNYEVALSGYLNALLCPLFARAITPSSARPSQAHPLSP